MRSVVYSALQPITCIFLPRVSKHLMPQASWRPKKPEMDWARADCYKSVCLWTGRTGFDVQPVRHSCRRSRSRALSGCRWGTVRPSCCPSPLGGCRPRLARVESQYRSCRHVASSSVLLWLAEGCPARCRLPIRNGCNPGHVVASAWRLRRCLGGGLHDSGRSHCSRHIRLASPCDP